MTWDDWARVDAAQARQPAEDAERREANDEARRKRRQWTIMGPHTTLAPDDPPAAVLAPLAPSWSTPAPWGDPPPVDREANLRRYLEDLRARIIHSGDPE